MITFHSSMGLLEEVKQRMNSNRENPHSISQLTTKSLMKSYLNSKPIGLSVNLMLKLASKLLHFDTKNSAKIVSKGHDEASDVDTGIQVVDYRFGEPMITK